MENNADMQQNSREINNHFKVKKLEKLANQTLADFSNSLRKRPENRNSKRKIVQIAGILKTKIWDPEQLNSNGQALTNLVKAFSQYSDNSDCKEATVQIAKFLNSKMIHQNLGINTLDPKQLNFNAEELRYLSLAFGKYPDDSDCERASARLLAQSLIGPNNSVCFYNEQYLSDLAHTFSKYSDDISCKRSIVQIAQTLKSRGGDAVLKIQHNFNAKNLSNLAYAFSKYPDDRDCKKVIVQIAFNTTNKLVSEVSKDKAWVQAGSYNFNPQNLSNLAYAFSVYPDDATCKIALNWIELFMIDKTWDMRSPVPKFNTQELVNLVHAFSKWPDKASRLSGTQLREAVTTDGEGFASSRIVKTDPST